MTDLELKALEELDEAIRGVVHSNTVKVDNYGKYGGHEGFTDIRTEKIAKALYEMGYRKVAEPCELHYTDEQLRERAEAIYGKFGLTAKEVGEGLVKLGDALRKAQKQIIVRAEEINKNGQ